MEYKKIIAIIIVVLVLAGGGYIIYSQRDAILNSAKKDSGQQENQPETKNYIVEEKTIKDATKPFNIDIRYPYIEGLDDFNAKVDSIVNSNISEFKSNSLENDNAVKQVDPESYAKYPRQYDINIGYSKGEIDGDVVSIIFEVYRFEGGAHGATNFIPLNYSPKNKKEIQLADMFPGQPNYIQKISDFCVPELKKQVTDRLGSTDGAWIQDGADAKADNFSVFMIKNDSLVFFFQQYQIAPYAAGDFQVTMPR